jgi:hypothetical protein|tara:strand:- start:13793 stop:14038 length:246 start_codon:yes stop_codon:yes gene_type:complete
MARKKVETKKAPQYAPMPEGNVEAHIIADMLRIESITAELREFKDDTKSRLDKLEGWIVAIVGITITTLLATVGTLVGTML